MYFHECITGNATPINDGAAGLRVVRMLEAAAESIKKRNDAVLLDKIQAPGKTVGTAALA
jgi:hypothetical protein